MARLDVKLGVGAFDSLSVAVEGSGRVFETRKVGTGGSSFAILTASALFAVSSLIVRAAFLTVPVRPAGLGRAGGGISSASLAALRSATTGRVLATSLCAISLSPRLGGLLTSSQLSVKLAFGLTSQLLTVEM